MTATGTRSSLTLILWVLLLLLGIVALLFLIQAYWFLTRTTEQDVRDLVGENLSVGASSEQIFDFLDSRGIGHSGVHKAEFTSIVLDAGYPKETDIISVILRNTSRTFFGTGFIQIFFILDSEYRMEDYIVQEGAP